MFPYPEQYRIATPPLTTAVMVAWALLSHSLFSDASPGPTKYALARLGHMAPDVRLPIVGPSEASRAAVDAALAHAGLI